MLANFIPFPGAGSEQIAGGDFNFMVSSVSRERGGWRPTQTLGVRTTDWAITDRTVCCLAQIKVGSSESFCLGKYFGVQSVPLSLPLPECRFY